MADDDSSSSRSRKKSVSKSTGKKSAQSSGTKASAAKSSKKSASSGDSSSRRSSDAPKAASSPKTSPGKLARTAAQQLLELTGRATEGVTSLEKDGDGWRVQVEVVEVRRIPNTTDVLALYEVDADDQGNLQGYRRIRRYVRGTPDEDR